jgi:hypothetical protein
MIYDIRFTIWLKRIAFTLLASQVLHPASLLAQGSLTPPGAPAPTMKTLTQIEPRTPISSLPFTISVPGSYYLTTNLTTAVSNAIVIATNGVTLDLGGFTIFSSVTNAASGGTAILIGSGLSDLTICNGHIRGGVTNNGSGVYSGRGFFQGVVYTGTAPINVRIAGVSVSGVLYTGIHVGNANTSVAESCTVQTAGGGGIGANTIKSCVARDVSSTAIFGNLVSDSWGQSQNDYGISANTAVNCLGTSDLSIGAGANNATSCQGISGSGTGLAATTAVSCLGHSDTGVGLSAYSAGSCWGTSDGSSGFGLQAEVANGCVGRNSAGGTGLWGIHLATGCYGYSATGTGLSSHLANSCVGETSSGVAQAITYKYNMP